MAAERGNLPLHRAALQFLPHCCHLPATAAARNPGLVRPRLGDLRAPPEVVVTLPRPPGVCAEAGALPRIAGKPRGPDGHGRGVLAAAAGQLGGCTREAALRDVPGSGDLMHPIRTAAAGRGVSKRAGLVLRFAAGGSPSCACVFHPGILHGAPGAVSWTEGFQGGQRPLAWGEAPTYRGPSPQGQEGKLRHR